MFRNIFLGLIAVLILSSTASASIVFNPSFFYYTRQEKSSSITEFDQQIINLKLGYWDTSGLYLGVAYDMESRKYGGSPSDEDRTSTGGTLGYISGGWSFFGTYYFSSDFEKYSGKGWSFDMGYIYNVGSFGIGPMITYRKFEYDTQSGAAVNPVLQHSNFLPCLQLQAVF
jgi:hypothetical protein